mgnify:CR=1 FL=1
MITKETARRIYNCYQQIEEIDSLKKEMLEEVEKAITECDMMQKNSRKIGMRHAS